MPGQATTLLHRVRLLAGRRPDVRLRALTTALQGSDAPVVGSTAGRVLDRCTPEVRARLAGSAGLLGAVQDRLLASGAGPTAVAGLAALWPTLAASERRAVEDPLAVLAHDARQTDGTTCGSAVLVLVAALGDPAVALWLASGRRLPGVPVRLPGGRVPVTPSTDVAPGTWGAPVGPDGSSTRTPTPDASRAARRARFSRAQRATLRRTNARAVLGLPWPTAFGTPPWGAAPLVRMAGVRYRPELVDDTDRGHLDLVLAVVGAALRRGLPVPLYTGGDTRRGWAQAVPRHVVLAVGTRPGGLDVWEPGAGRVVPLSRSTLLAGRPDPALGGWSHLTWALLPDLR